MYLYSEIQRALGCHSISVTWDNTKTCVMRQIFLKLCIGPLLPVFTEWLSLCLHLIFPDIVKPEQGENQADSMFVMPVVVTCLHFCSNSRAGGWYLRLEWIRVNYHFYILFFSYLCLFAFWRDSVSFFFPPSYIWESVDTRCNCVWIRRETENWDNLRTLCINFNSVTHKSLGIVLGALTAIAYLNSSTDIEFIFIFSGKISTLDICLLETNS